MNDLDDQLNRTLREHADGVHGAPLAFDDVRGRATSIRRRRRLASGLGVAAAIAVIVPTAMFATNGNDSSPQPATGAADGHRHQHPVADLVSTPVMGSDPHALDVTGLPTGAPPAVGPRWSPTVSRARLDRRRPSVRWMPEEGVVVEARRPDLRPVPELVRAWPLNAAGTAVAWATDEGEVMTWQDGSRRAQHPGRAPGSRACASWP